MDTNQLVAVYGTLRKGCEYHFILEDSVYKGTEVLKGEYTMIDLGAYPAILLEGNTPITVEVYEVDELVFGRLDDLEIYPDFYNRIQVKTSVGMAWIYFLNDDANRTSRPINSGDWTKKYD